MIIIRTSGPLADDYTHARIVAAFATARYKVHFEASEVSLTTLHHYQVRGTNSELDTYMPENGTVLGDICARLFGTTVGYPVEVIRTEWVEQ